MSAIQNHSNLSSKPFFKTIQNSFKTIQFKTISKQFKPFNSNQTIQTKPFKNSIQNHSNHSIQNHSNFKTIQIWTIQNSFKFKTIQRTIQNHSNSKPFKPFKFDSNLHSNLRVKKCTHLCFRKVLLFSSLRSGKAWQVCAQKTEKNHSHANSAVSRQVYVHAQLVQHL